MAVIDLSSPASWRRRLRVKRVARPAAATPFIGQLPLGSFTQGRTRRRAIAECAASTLVLIAAVAAMVLLGAG